MPLVDSREEGGSPLLAAALSERFTAFSNGLMIADSGRKTPYYFLAATEFELWVGEVENGVGNPIGRKLAHAAAESEEFRLESLRDDLPNPLFGKMKKRMEWVNRNWNIRNLGQMEIMETEKESAKVMVHSRPHSAFAAGMAAATYEYLSGKRYRFHWSDDGSSETMLTLEIDNRQIPVATRVDCRWNERDGLTTQAEGMHPLALAYQESAGCWSIDGIRFAGIPQDLILRLEESLLSTMLDRRQQTGNQFEWQGVSDVERGKVWGAFANASRTRFLANDDMVLIAEPEHWIHVGHRFLARAGLGAVDNAESIDENGGVKLQSKSLLHPALACGILAGAWERSEGRPASVVWSSNHNGHTIEITSLRTIA